MFVIIFNSLIFKKITYDMSYFNKVSEPNDKDKDTNVTIPINMSKSSFLK